MSDRKERTVIDTGTVKTYQEKQLKPQKPQAQKLPRKPADENSGEPAKSGPKK